VTGLWALSKRQTEETLEDEKAADGKLNAIAARLEQRRSVERQVPRTAGRRLQ
jgi:hypothetical protein